MTLPRIDSFEDLTRVLDLFRSLGLDEDQLLIFIDKVFILNVSSYLRSMKYI